MPVVQLKFVVHLSCVIFYVNTVSCCCVRRVICNLLSASYWSVIINSVRGLELSFTGSES